jgi:hypothetical protein
LFSPVIIACLCNIFMQTFYVVYFHIVNVYSGSASVV